MACFQSILLEKYFENYVQRLKLEGLGTKLWKFSFFITDSVFKSGPFYWTEFNKQFYERVFSVEKYHI